MYAPRRVAPLLLGMLGLALIPAACRILPEEDNFVCGVRVNNTGAVSRCDGPGEICLCSGNGASRTKNRCATPERAECESGYRFTFAEEEDGEPPCVPDAGLERFVTADSNALCEPEGEVRCGVPGSNGATLRCAPNQYCHCPMLRCAEPWPDCGDGGLPARFVDTGECVGPQDGGVPAVRERPDGTCPGFVLGDLLDAGTD